ncbi:MAG: histidine phosphatase family protein [Limnoraphis robusta]|uniref:Phosphoglycerate mutase n=1 Tax=Limnoraphis robusta CS-951 TaxID=1637645 RepID=A0A0F5Y8X4_9CYAN|nr:histidine phosphatase family protein [Limnoraphis robusta]KKD34660.1 phosphoglycerate mutase [Limnoraphis robusta CS-951]
MTQTVWIARHGNRIDFVNPAWFNTSARRYDPHLSDDGFVQAQQLANRLVGEGITHIFSSPFLRTVQTANVIAETLDLPLKLNWGLGEWLNPEWMSTYPETLTSQILAQQFPRIDLSYPIGEARYPETWEDCLDRTAKTAQNLVAAFPDEDLLFVGHGASVVGTAMGLVPTLAETDIHASLCCLVKLVRDDNQWKVELNGDISHLNNTETVIRFN